MRKLWMSIGVAAALVATLALAQTADAHGGFGGRGGDDGELLADKLGISVEELKEARQAVAAERLEQALADGRIDEEQAELMRAGMALRGAIDPQALMAEALGLSVEELEQARQDGTSPRELMESAGLDRDELHERMVAAREAAVAQAVADGVITQEQADLLAERGMRGRMGGAHGRFGRPGGHRGPGGGFGERGAEGAEPLEGAPTDGAGYPGFRFRGGDV